MAVWTWSLVPVWSGDYYLSNSFGEWCNGSTADSGSVCLGSNPSSPAFQKGVFRGGGPVWQVGYPTEARSVYVAASYLPIFFQTQLS